VEGEFRQATLGCSATGSRLPAVPMGLAHPLHLADPLHLPHPDSGLPHPLHLAADSDLVLDLVDPLHLAHPDSDLVLDSDSDSAIPDGSGDDDGSESYEETALQDPLPDQSHHPEDGEAEDGGCHPVADHPCLHAIG
jgi:hypothetical protein